MDIHRARFVPYQPSAINTLAFSHTTGTSLHGQPLKLALGRSNGDIEIWNPLRGTWIQERIFKGGKDRSCESLVWIHDPDHVVKTETGRERIIYGRARLFSVGYSANVTEWDLCTGLPRRQSGGAGGEVWCLAAQPAADIKKLSRSKGSKKQNGEDAPKTNGTTEEEEEQAQHQHLVAGCADGTLVLLSTEDDDLTFRKYIARASKKNARVLSLAFQDRHTVVAGFSDSTIRVYDIRDGKLLRNMSLGGGPTGGPKDKLVWAVECLRDRTIVSADSSGEVTFFDGKTYGILQRIKGHEADALCLTSSDDGMTVFSGGMDRRTCVYNLSAAEGQRKRWAKSTHRRFHEHDVKAMARFDSAKMSVVVSGGLDTTPILIALRDFGKEYHRTLPFVPQLQPVVGAGRLVITWQTNELEIWRIGRRKDQQEDFAEEPEYQRVAHIVMKGDEYISTAGISPNARLLAVATVAGTKFFHLRRSVDGGLKVRKLEAPNAVVVHGSRLLHFSPDSRWMLSIDARNQLTLALLEASGAGTKPTIDPKLLTLRRLRREVGVQNGLNGDWGSYDRTITRCAFSSDSRMLAVSDLSGYMDVFVLEDRSAPLGSEKPNGIVKEDDQALHSPASSDNESASNSDSDSTLSDDAFTSSRKSHRSSATINNLTWRLAPSSHLIPRLQSQPIILSFQPDFSSSTSTTENPPPDTLLTLTATHQLSLFSIHAGRLIDWSRRNPSALLPEQFKIQRERAIGCLWDVQAGKQRIWLYGPTWLCMLDLTKDLPRPPPERGATEAAKGLMDDSLVPTPNKDTSSANSKSKKRKRNGTHASEALPSKKGTTGAAGSKMPPAEQSGAIGPLKQKTAAHESWTDVSQSEQRRQINSTDLRNEDDKDSNTDANEDDDEEDEDEIAFLTRPVSDAEMQISQSEVETDNAPHTNGDVNGAHVDGTGSGEVDGAGDIHGPGGAALTKRSQRSQHWRQRFGPKDENRAQGYTSLDGGFFITSRYRPILGVVALVDEVVDEGSGSGAVGRREGGQVDGVHGGEKDGAMTLRKQRDDDGQSPLEVLVVERPFWELKLPPRFSGPQDWGEK